MGGCHKESKKCSFCMELNVVDDEEMGEKEDAKAGGRPALYTRYSWPAMDGSCLCLEAVPSTSF